MDAGEPIALALPDPRAAMRWSIEPAGFELRLLDVHTDNVARVVFDPGARSGRVTVRVHAEKNQ